MVPCGGAEVQEPVRPCTRPAPHLQAPRALHPPATRLGPPLPGRLGKRTSTAPRALHPPATRLGPPLPGRLGKRTSTAPCALHPPPRPSKAQEAQLAYHRSTQRTRSSGGA
eukprot:99807-Chlamydomonas_euryale.AAC.1